MALASLVAVLVAGAATAVRADEYQGPKRVEFDDRLIKGQTARAGAVYIYNRQKSDVRSLVVLKRQFLPHSIRAVFGDRE
jgi:hypothetical protein